MLEHQVPASRIPFIYDIHFVDCAPSPATQDMVEQHLARLSHFYDRIVSARVFIRIPHKNRGSREYQIHVQLDVPGRRLVVSREPKASEMKLALREMFLKLTRQLEDFVKHRQDLKALPTVWPKPLASERLEEETQPESDIAL